MQRPVSADRLVLAGFAALLILMGALAADSARQARVVSATSSQLRKGSRDRDTLLDQLLTDTYRSATLVRDYVLEQDDLHASRQKSELVTLRSRIDDALNRYAAMAPEPEADAAQSLKQHAEMYWNSLAPALDWSGSARREGGERFLQTVVVPRRDEWKQVAIIDSRTIQSTPTSGSRPSAVAASPGTTPKWKKRSSIANPAAFEPTARSAVTGIGAPGYTSGAHM